ncbi:MAG: phage major capsid protein [Planctomycetaceae bacterium]
MIRVTKLRRLYEAALQDRSPDKFFDEFEEALRTRQIGLDDFSIRQLFEQFIPDGRELVGSWSPRHGDGAGVSLVEEVGAVSAGAFSRISGQLVYSAILDSFAGEQFVFSPLVRTIPTQFSGEKLAGISRIGDEAEVVAEGRPYPQAGVSEDYIETPATTKRGLIVGLTREAVFFDRTNLVSQRCREVGEFLGLNKEKRVIDCVIDENTTAHRYKWKGTTYATYQPTTPWVNVTGTNALVDWSDIDAAEQTLAQLVDPYTGEPILVSPRHLVVTRPLLYTARRVVNATEIRVNTPGYATSGNPTETITSNPVQGYQIVSSALLAARMATDTNWFIGDLTRAFAYMENWPLTVVQAPSNSEVEFTHDIVMRWKASERGACATIEPRNMHKSTA